MDQLDTERDFNVVMNSPRFEGLSARFMQHCVRDELPPPGVFNAFFAASLRGVVPGSAKYDVGSGRFTKIPTAPASKNDLGSALMGIMNSCLDFCEREEMVYFTPPSDISRKMTDGEKWIKSDLCIVNFEMMMSDKAYQRNMKSKGFSGMIFSFC